MLRETDQDSVALVAKRRRVSEATIYIWCKKFGQFDTGDVKRLKALKAENVRLKKMLVNRGRGNEVMTEINEKVVSRPHLPENFATKLFSLQRKKIYKT